MGLGNYTKCLFVEDLVETEAPHSGFYTSLPQLELAWSSMLV